VVRVHRGPPLTSTCAHSDIDDATSRSDEVGDAALTPSVRFARYQGVAIPNGAHTRRRLDCRTQHGRARRDWSTS